jgi:hypothetical protein
MRIDEKLGMKLSPTMSAAELDGALLFLANMAAARAAAITGNTKEAAYELGGWLGAAKAFRACIE